MADRDRERDRAQPQQARPQHGRYDGGFKSQRDGPSASKIMATLAALPVGGTLLAIAAITFVLSLTGLAVVTPLFVIFSPILVPAASAACLALVGFLTSGALGLTGLTSLSWVLNCFRQGSGGSMMPLQLEDAKKRMQDAAVQLGQKTKQMGETIQQKAQEVGRDQR